MEQIAQIAAHQELLVITILTNVRHAKLPVFNAKIAQINAQNAKLANFTMIMDVIANV